MKGKNFVFTSESVTEGHPDKIADQISDAVLDALIRDDPSSRVACETLVKNAMVVIAGEITTATYVHLPDIAREVIRRIGYNDSSIGFDWETCAVLSSIDRQSPDISQGVTAASSQSKEQGAGDQGMMFGFANTDTPEFMPMPISLAHRLTRRLAEVRHKGELDFLRPDGKSQVSVVYQDGRPTQVANVVISTQHNPDIEHRKLCEAVIETIIKPVVPADMLRKDTVFHVNPTGRFVVGGPYGDCGMTGRKIIVDTYVGWSSLGGGAFSG